MITITLVHIAVFVPIIFSLGFLSGAAWACMDRVDGETSFATRVQRDYDRDNHFV